MSNPANILGQFRSYSYHHYLAVTNGITAALNLSDSSELLLRGAQDRTEQRFEVNLLPGSQTDFYMLLVDGRRDAKFFIDNVKWESFITPNRIEGGRQFSDTSEVGGEIQIIEPFGMQLLQILADASRKMRIHSGIMCYVLKTVFVGITHDHQEHIISNIRPLLFSIYDLNIVTNAGSCTYNFRFMGINNGIANSSHYSKVASGINITIGGDSTKTVGQALKTLEEEINNKYDKYVDFFKTQIEKSDSDLNIDRDFMLLEFEFIIDKIYYEPTYVAGDNISIRQNGTINQQTISSTANSTVKTLIEDIMNSSTAIIKDANTPSEDGSTFGFKILSTLSKPSNPSKIKIQYNIHRQIRTTRDIGSTKSPSPGEFIEFDYFYSGKNIDIIEFDMNMKMGTAFFFTVSVEPNERDTSDVSSSAVNLAQHAGYKPTPGIKIPLSMGSTLDKPLIRNKLHPLDTATFDAMMQQYAAYEQINARLVIAGNPQLLDELLIKPNEISKGKTEPTNKGTTGAHHQTKIPAYIKVNVYFPTDDTVTKFKPYWYTGYYHLLKVENNFNSGLFTQELRLFSLPTESALKPPNTNSSEQEQNSGDGSPSSSTNNEDLIPIQVIEQTFKYDSSEPAGA